MDYPIGGPTSRQFGDEYIIGNESDTVKIGSGQDELHELTGPCLYLLKQGNIPENRKELRKLINDKVKAFDAEVKEALYSDDSIDQGDKTRYKKHIKFLVFRTKFAAIMESIKYPVLYPLLAFFCVAVFFSSLFLPMLTPVAVSMMVDGLQALVAVGMVAGAFVGAPILAFGGFFGIEVLSEPPERAGELEDFYSRVAKQRKEYIVKLGKVYDDAESNFFKNDKNVIPDHVRAFQEEVKTIKEKRKADTRVKEFKKRLNERGVPEKLMDAKGIEASLRAFAVRVPEIEATLVDSAIGSIIELWKDEKNQSEDDNESVLLGKIGSLLELFSSKYHGFFIKIVAENDTNVILGMKEALLAIIAAEPSVESGAKEMFRSEVLTHILNGFESIAKSIKSNDSKEDNRERYRGVLYDVEKQFPDWTFPLPTFPLFPTYVPYGTHPHSFDNPIV